VALIALSLASTPRRVGDGGEYLVMTLQLASGRPPSVSTEELRAWRTELATLGPGFASALLDYPDLVEPTTGRQEFLHFFLYPLLVSPVMRLVTAAGMHPNWAFTLANAMMLAGALFVVARRASPAVAVAAFASPIVWWVDKAHTEVFLFAMMVVASVTVRAQPSLSVIAFALAGAQNAALGATYPVFALLVVWMRRARPDRKLIVSAVCGATLVATPILYTWIRLGRLSPMAEHAALSMPDVRALAAFVFEPNIGLLPHAPAYGLALLCAVSLMLSTRLRARAAAAWWWPAVIQALLLLAWSQNPNANHGGTPALNRWTLSLLAVAVPWIGDVSQVVSRRQRRALFAAACVLGVLAVWTHLPARPESYTTPLRTAAALWHAGLVHVSPAEVFAERAHGAEPAVLPTHDGDCRVLLIAHGQSPVHCIPPADPLPPACRALCFAVVSGEGTRYLPAADNGFVHALAPVSWPAGGPLAAGLRRLLADHAITERVWRVDDIEPWRTRFGEDLRLVLRASNVVLGYLPEVSPATLERLQADLRTALVTLTPYEPVSGANRDLANVAFVLRVAD
jgi:hypothetical protein